jgi:hypothetical protein
VWEIEFNTITEKEITNLVIELEKKLNQGSTDKLEIQELLRPYIERNSKIRQISRLKKKVDDYKK